MQIKFEMQQLFFFFSNQAVKRRFPQALTNRLQRLIELRFGLGNDAGQRRQIHQARIDAGLFQIAQDFMHIIDFAPVNIRVQGHFFLRVVVFADIVIAGHFDRLRKMALLHTRLDHGIQAAHILALDAQTAFGRGRADSIPIGRLMQHVLRVILPVDVAIQLHKDRFHVIRHFDAHGLERRFVERVGMRDDLSG